MQNHNCAQKSAGLRPISSPEQLYEIKVDAHLESHWSEWFDQWRVTPQRDGTTTMIGPAADQAALHGLLIKIRNLNLPLISVHRLDSEG